MSDEELKQFINVVNLPDDDIYNLDASVLDEAASTAFDIGHELTERAKIKIYGDYKRFEGKYVKIFKDGITTYIKVRTCFITSRRDRQKELCIQGVGFHSLLNQPYEDDNFAYFATWVDEYISTDMYRKKPDMITEISYDEYKLAFEEMCENLIDTFGKWDKD